MADNHWARFTQSSLLAARSISAANPNDDGTGTYADLVSGITTGRLITAIGAKARGSTSAGRLKFILNRNATLFVLPITLVVPLRTIAAGAPNIPPWQEIIDLTNLGLVLSATTDKIQVATHNGEAFDVTAFGGDFV